MNKTPKGHSPQIPWWVHILFATLLYIGCTYFAPTLHTENQWLSTLLHIAPNLAPIGTIAFLLLGAKALYDTPKKEIDPQDSEEGTE